MEPSPETPERLWLFAGGGTGGHITPGLAVAEELLRRSPQDKILFCGTGRSVERSMVAAAGFEHRELPAQPLGALLGKPVRFLRDHWQGYHTIGRWLTELQPAAVIGLGGYACVTPILRASFRRLPCVMLEQNAIPGRAVRWLAGRVGRVCLAYPESRRRLPGRARAVITGNPVRQPVAELVSLALPERSARHLEEPVVLVLGGSQGARGLNAGLVAALSTDGFASRFRCRWIHQTGTADFDAVRAAYARSGVTADVRAFFDNLPEIYQQATVVISRAGATTLAELACAGLPAILVPYPKAADNHQLANARFFVEAGGAVLLEQDVEPTALGHLLVRELLKLLAVEGEWLRRAQAMRAQANPGAAAAVVDEILGLVKGPEPVPSAS